MNTGYNEISGAVEEIMRTPLDPKSTLNFPWGNVCTQAGSMRRKPKPPILGFIADEGCSVAVKVFFEDRLASIWHTFLRQATSQPRGGFTAKRGVPARNGNAPLCVEISSVRKYS